MGSPFAPLATSSASRASWPDTGHSAAPAPTALATLEPVALAATRAAALACQDWVGRGDKEAADAAATDAMRARLSTVAGVGRVVIGEGEKDDAPMLYNGERLGRGGAPEFDIAVDPLECTTLCAKGLAGALATIAFAEAGALGSPGPALYMDKLVAPAAAREAIDIRAPAEHNLARVSEALAKPVSELCVVVLDKPRHAELVERLHACGARVATPSDGDVAGALGALLPWGEADLLMGIGGTPEGVMTACAVHALDGAMQVRLAPQREDEARAVAGAGLDTERVYELEDLVSGEAFFVATGVSGGELLRRPWPAFGQMMTESLVVAGGTVRTVIEGIHSAGLTAPAREPADEGGS